MEVVLPPAIRTNAPPEARQPTPRGLVVPDSVNDPYGSPAGGTSGTRGADIPRAAGSWHFSVVGDFGDGSANEARVAAQILAGAPGVVLTVGDNVYEKGLEDEYRRYFDPDRFYGQIHRTVPMLPSLGNHDVKRTPTAYFKRFPHLEGARYYSADRDGVHFVALDTNESLAPGTPQYRWLEQDLSQAAEGWKVLYFHHPMMSSTSGRSDRLKLTEYLGPLLAKHGVDLVLSGHDHSYERSNPLNPSGTIHVRTGTGGRDLDGFDQRQPAWSAFRHNGYGFVDVEVTADALVGRFISDTGQVMDTFSVSKASAQGAAA